MSEREAIKFPHADATPAERADSATAVEYGLTYDPSDVRVVGAVQVLLEWLLSTPEHEAELQRRMEAVGQESPAGESKPHLDCTPRRKRKRAA